MYRKIIQDLLQVEKPVRVVLGITVAIGVALVVWGAEQWLRFQPSLHWPTVAGVIIRSEYANLDEILKVSSFAMIINNHVHSAHVSYRYAVGGLEHTSSQISLSSSDLSGGFYKPRAFVEAHPAGLGVLVYYEPGDPQNAVLIPGADKALDWGLMLGGAAVVALSLIAYRSQIRKIHREYKAT